MKPLVAALCYLVACLFSTVAVAQEYIQSYENGVDRPGSDIASFVPEYPDPEICARACRNDVNCAAFTYVHPANGYSAGCWLKGAAPAPVANACCVSGVVAHLAPAGAGQMPDPSQSQPDPSAGQPSAPAAGSQAAADVATPEGEAAVRDCFAYWQGADLANCLTNAAVTHFDEAICAYDPTYQCHRLAADGLMDRCRTLSPEKQEICFSAVAVEWKEPDSCARANNPQYCVAQIAIETRNPQLIHQRMGNDPNFDLYAALYASSTGDPTVIDWIADGDKADMTQIMTIAAAAARGQPLPDSMCYTWRGDGSQGLLPTAGGEEYTAAATQFCQRARAQAEALRAAAANMSEEQLIELLKEYESALARGENPDMAMQRLIGQAAAPPPATAAAPSAPGDYNAVVPAEITPLNGLPGGTGLLGQGN